VDAPHEERDVEVLDEAECLALMATMSLGRIAFTEGALPAVQPVAFALGDGEVFVATHRGSNVAVASRDAVVAFEVDDFDAGARTGWNVTVVGATRVISDADEVGRLDEFGLQPWTPADGHCYIGIQTRLVRGRRISRRAPPLAGVAAGLDGSPHPAFQPEPRPVAEYARGALLRRPPGWEPGPTGPEHLGDGLGHGRTSKGSARRADGDAE
jgi:hypothetical protein